MSRGARPIAADAPKVRPGPPLRALAVPAVARRAARARSAVDALGGSPGVYSARYAGEPKSDARNNQALLDALENQTNRRAHYYCVLVFVRHPDDPQPLIAEGEWHGEILTAPQGDGGFGYDPLFLVPEFKRTAAQLEREQKHAISHRGKAMQVLLQKLARYLPRA